MTEAKVWQAWPGQQTAFLSSPAFEAFYGGQAGPGKTECMVMDALRQIAHPKYTSRFFRRLFPSLEGANGPIQRSMEWYPAYGGVYNGSKHMWRFPSGARIYFSAMQYLDDMYQFQGDELTTAYFDELPEFDPKQYLFIFTRVRAAAPGLFPYVRSAGNPGGVGRAFVRQRFIKQDIRNKIGYFLQTPDGDTRVTRDTPGALSRAFYPATLADNPAADPDYAPRILATGDPVLIAQLLYGDFDAEYLEGRIYDNWTLDNISADLAAYDPSRPVYWGVDDGYVLGKGRGDSTYHPRIVLFAQDGPQGDVRIFDEYEATGETHDETLYNILGPADGSAPERVTRWQQYRRPDIVYIDSSAAMFKAEIGKRDITTKGSTHIVVEGIKNVRRLIKDGNGVIMLHVHPLCTNLIYEMGAYRSDPKARSDSGELLPLKADDHSQDSLRYLCWHKRWDTPGQ